MSYNPPAGGRAIILTAIKIFMVKSIACPEAFGMAKKNKN